MHVLYVHILLICILSMKSALSSLNISSSLSFMLTKNDSVSWLESMTKLNKNPNEYCKICCINIFNKNGPAKHCGTHTMCKYSGTGTACKGYIKMGMSNKERELLIDAHNTLRNFVAGGLEKRGSNGSQPMASNMREVEWNEKLAKIAERWAQQCYYQHDDCRDLPDFPVGQNIARSPFSNRNDLLLLKSWYDQVKNFNQTEINSYVKRDNFNDPASINSYTQLIWADTYLIGCARSIFQAHFKNSSVTYVEHLICNYGPTGNIPDQSIYQIGRPCSGCPEGTGCLSEYPNLCGKNGTYDVKRLNISDENLGIRVSFCRFYFIYISVHVILYLNYICTQYFY